jgi:hypothetical protein
MVTRLAILIPLLLVGAPGARAQRFLPDDPIREDRDSLPIDPPAEIELSTKYDVIENTLHHRPHGAIPRAVDVNTLGEVPDSSWFTNRIGVRPMSIEELVRGADRTGGPDLSRPLTVIAGKSGGITPGFTVRDARGDVYFVKFDPLAHPNLSTAPEVIVSKFFHAFGYNVPENTIADLAPLRLQMAPGAEVEVPGRLQIGLDAQVSVRGKGNVPMTPDYLDNIFANAARGRDGRIRIVASRALSGTPIGPFKFYGTRGDDPNDVFPHQDRRELRGYRVFCAWLNHDDSRSLNTLDTFVLGDAGGGRGHVPHHLIHFSSTLGSGSNEKREISPQGLRGGNEYLFELGPVFKTLLSFGLWERPWRNVTYPDVPEIGRFEGDFFRPERWKPEYPNPAFERMLPDDAFWAARIVARFSDEAIRALVATGAYADPRSARYLADTLIQRRDKVVAWCFGRVNPLDGFRVEGSSLEFDNLGEQAGLGAVRSYEYAWFAFDNATERATPLGEPGRTGVRRIPIPAGGAGFLKVRIRTLSAEQPLWRKSVDVYLREAAGPTVVGIEREN